LNKEEIEVHLTVNASPTGKPNEESLRMIKAFVDEFTINEEGPVVITMVKRHKESIFD
jgi:hypothetical protein